jgi:hypothetical protein
MNTEIDADGRPIAFRLDIKHSRWHALEEPAEAAFPLITIVGEKRYELYSDGSLAEVER